MLYQLSYTPAWERRLYNAKYALASDDMRTI